MKISVDDGCRSDLKVAELCAKYDIECIFYLPVEWTSLAHSKGYEPLTYEEACKLAESFDIGSHTITHRHLTKIPFLEACREIADSQIMLQNLFHRRISKFCPPRGYSNEDLTKWTLSLYDEQRLTKQKGLVHVHPNSGANGNRKWQECVDEETKELFLHSHELDRFGLWEELEAFLARLPS